MDRQPGAKKKTPTPGEGWEFFKSLQADSPGGAAWSMNSTRQLLHSPQQLESEQQEPPDPQQPLSVVTQLERVRPRAATPSRRNVLIMCFSV